jgi:hypothetical protein
MHGHKRLEPGRGEGEGDRMVWAVAEDFCTAGLGLIRSFNG